MDRSKQIVRVSIVGILANLVLVAFKAAVGLITGSIAVTLDALNNLSDALSSVITILGTRLANRPPDKKHPYGYGRIEHISSVTIAVIVLLAGVTSFRESLLKIIHPEAANYSVASLVIIGVAVLVKVFLGRYVKKRGEALSSESLVASGTDALFDAILSLSTLVAAIISIFFHVSLEGILGVIIAVVIIKASIDMLKETLDSMIGARVDSELSRKIKESICEMPEVYGAYDLSLHNYGPEDMQGSVHVEIDDTLTALDIQKLTRRISAKIFKEFSIILTVGIYAHNDTYSNIRDDLYNIASKYPEVLEIHAFIVYEEENLITFDIIVDFDADRESVKQKILEEIKSLHPEFNYHMIDDYDVSD